MRAAHKGLLYGTGPIPKRGAPVLPVIRHFQVLRELCPETQAGFPDLVGYGLQVVRNTYQIANTL